MLFRTSRDVRVKMLRDAKLLSGCSDAELRRLAAISTVIDVDGGRVVVEQGAPGRDFFVILDGRATVTLNGDQLAILGPGSFFGEMALLNASSRVATVTSCGPMTLLALSQREFATLLSSLPATVARRMLAGVTGRLREADLRAAAVEAGGVPGKPVGVGAGSFPSF
jgi:CRP-like cAMP-binding protein